MKVNDLIKLNNLKVIEKNGKRYLTNDFVEQEIFYTDKKELEGIVSFLINGFEVKRNNFADDLTESVYKISSYCYKTIHNLTYYENWEICGLRK